MHLLTMAGNARNSTAQAEESLASLEREAERLAAELDQAQRELENLGVQSGQAKLRFESASESLSRLEGEITALRESFAGAPCGRRRAQGQGKPTPQCPGHRDGTPQFP